MHHSDGFSGSSKIWYILIAEIMHCVQQQHCALRINCMKINVGQIEGARHWTKYQRDLVLTLTHNFQVWVCSDFHAGES